MTHADKPLAPIGQIPADLVVLGGGVAGCWAALKGLRAGLSVVQIEMQQIGAGASGGFLGALMPHMPERWDDKKNFQFAALVDLEAETNLLEAETGLLTGYRRVGRLMPLSTGRQRKTAEMRGHEAARSWQRLFSHHLVSADSWPDWLNPETAPFGMIHDTLSARISPLNLLAALVRACGNYPGFTLMEACECARVDHKTSHLRLADGRSIGYGHLLLCNGMGAFGLIEDIYGYFPGSLGNPVKGQAALFEVKDLPASPDDLPLVFDNGVYVIAHGDGHVAVGSTSETEFGDPDNTDEKLDGIIARAVILCPALQNARPLLRWAALRPRPAGRDPMLGKLPGHDNILTIAGGYKITFGIAHRMADAALAEIGATAGPAIPPTFAPEHHFKKAAARALEKHH